MKVSQNSNSNYLIRTQFSFRVNDAVLNTLLGRIADNGTSITGYAQIKSSQFYNLNSVRMVVGPPASINPAAVRFVRNLLTSRGIRFQEERVIQILKTVPGTPGVIRSIYRALRLNVKVKAIYLGEATAIFVNTSNVAKSIQILKQKKII